MKSCAHTGIDHVQNWYQSTANRLFSLPWNYPNKWTVPLNLQRIILQFDPYNFVFYVTFFVIKQIA